MCQSSELEDGPLFRSHTFVIICITLNAVRTGDTRSVRCPGEDRGALLYYGKTLRPYIPLAPG